MLGTQNSEDRFISALTRTSQGRAAATLALAGTTQGQTASIPVSSLAPLQQRGRYSSLNITNSPKIVMIQTMLPHLPPALPPRPEGIDDVEGRILPEGEAGGAGGAEEAGSERDIVKRFV